MPPRVIVKKDPENPEPIELLEREIKACAEGARALLNSRLRRRALLVLLSDSSGVNRTTIERVLTAAANLDKDYLVAQ